MQESNLRFHGNLKASNCLVDSRWVLKIADFGLEDFRQTLPNVEYLLADHCCHDEATCIDLLYRYRVYHLLVDWVALTWILSRKNLTKWLEKIDERQNQIHPNVVSEKMNHRVQFLLFFIYPTLSAPRNCCVSASPRDFSNRSTPTRSP